MAAPSAKRLGESILKGHSGALQRTSASIKVRITLPWAA
jgi:hypothetical protein